MQVNKKRKRDLDNGLIFNYEKMVLMQALERKQDTEKQLRSFHRVLKHGKRIQKYGLSQMKTLITAFCFSLLIIYA